MASEKVRYCTNRCKLSDVPEDINDEIKRMLQVIQDNLQGNWKHDEQSSTTYLLNDDIFDKLFICERNNFEVWFIICHALDLTYL